MEKHEFPERIGNGYGDEIVGNGQEPGLLPRCPLLLFETAAGRAVPVVATVVEEERASAIGTVVPVTAAPRGAAGQYGLDRVPLARGDRAGNTGYIGRPVRLQDVCETQVPGGWLVGENLIEQRGLHVASFAFADLTRSLPLVSPIRGCLRQSPPQPPGCRWSVTWR